MNSGSAIITGVDFVSIPSQDVEAAVAFYGDVLGLPCIAHYTRHPGAEFQAGNLTIQILDSAAHGLEFHPNGHPIALHVEDMAGARARLEERGVKFAAETLDTGVCHMAVFRDPDGNRLMLHHRYVPR